MRIAFDASTISTQGGPRTRGRERAELFSWEAAARETLAIYLKYVRKI